MCFLYTSKWHHTSWLQTIYRCLRYLPKNPKVFPAWSFSPNGDQAFFMPRDGRYPRIAGTQFLGLVQNRRCWVRSDAMDGQYQKCMDAASRVLLGCRGVCLNKSWCFNAPRVIKPRHNRYLNPLTKLFIWLILAIYAPLYPSRLLTFRPVNFRLRPYL